MQLKPDDPIAEWIFPKIQTFKSHLLTAIVPVKSELGTLYMQTFSRSQNVAFLAKKQLLDLQKLQ